MEQTSTNKQTSTKAEKNEDKKRLGKSDRGNRRRKVVCFTTFFVALFFLCSIVGGTLWAGGWAKDMTCNIVLEDSYVWKKASCQSQTEVEYDVDQGEVIDMNITDEFSSQEELITTIIDEASPAVVTVTVNSLEFNYESGYQDVQDGIGSGFVVDSSGLIITNQHVVSDENADYSVLIPGEEEAVPVDEIYRDNTNDIAILKIEKEGLKALKLGDSEKLLRGNIAIAIGSPFGDLKGTATIGYITGLNREVYAGGGFWGETTYYEGVIQTDAAINPGNSGGPLLNSKGEVIGVNFATTQGADNISFAIPINQLKARLKVFEQEGRFPQPYIGVSYSQRTVYMKEEVVTGAVIIQVEKEGPADKAGVERGDIIIQVDDKSMAEYGFSTTIQAYEVGDKVDLEIWRDGETQEITVTIGDRGEE